MKKKRTLAQNAVLGIAGVLFIIAVWYLAAYLMRLRGNRILPYPDKVAAALGEILFGEEADGTYVAVGYSLLRVVIGFAGSFVLGAILGTLAGLYPKFRAFMAPGVSITRALPTAAVVSVLVGIFYGVKGLPDYIPCVLGLLVAFPIIYEAFLTGIAEMDKDVRESLDLDAGSRSLKGIVFVSWPMSASYVKLSSVQSLGLCLKVTIMSEIMVSGGMTSGLGVLIGEYQLNLEMAKVIAVSLLTIAIILVVDLSTMGFKRREKAKIKAAKESVNGKSE